MVISFHLGVSFSFWPFGPSFSLILALWAFIFFPFGLSVLAFGPLGCWLSVLSLPCIWAFGVLTFCPSDLLGAPPLCAPSRLVSWPCFGPISTTASRSCGRLSRPLEARCARTTSGTVSPVQLMLNDAARVSQALAPVLHREGLLVGPLPTDNVLHGKPDRVIRFVPCYLFALGSCRQVQSYLHSHASLLLHGPVSWVCTLCYRGHLFFSGALKCFSMLVMLFRWNSTCFRILWQLWSRLAEYNLNSKLQHQVVFHCPTPSFKSCVFCWLLPPGIHNMTTALLATF